MAYRFKVGESVQAGARRIGIEQIDRAIGELDRSDNRVVAVHETRKGLKRIRALLRLLRPGLGEQTFKGDNARFRDIAVLLSQDRDSDVLTETALKLEARSGGEGTMALSALRRLMQESGTRPSVEATATRIAEARDRLLDARKDFGELKLDADDFDTLCCGLEASYRRARRAMAAAYLQGSAEAFHEWRKSVQQHWRHMALLTRAWPEMFAARVAAARRLSQILGDDHDVEMLVAHIRGPLAGGIGKQHLKQIERIARSHQRDLRAAAEPIGAQLFVETARGHAGRIAEIWAAAVRMHACAYQPAADTPVSPPVAEETKRLA